MSTASQFRLLFSVAFVIFVCTVYVTLSSSNANLLCQWQSHYGIQTQNNSGPIFVNNLSPEQHDYTVVIGIPTPATTTERRMQIRMTYISRYPEVFCSFCSNRHTKPKVRVLFFIGKVKEGLELLQTEQEMFGDMVFLDVAEAMNQGKTYEMLLWLTKNTRARYIMKADDDTFLVIPNLIKRLEHYSPHLQSNNTHIYYGFSIFEKPTTRNVFMAGMGYILDFNLTHTLVNAKSVTKIGPEDIRVSQWVHREMNAGTNVIQIGNTRHFHDTPHHTGVVSWEYNCQDVLLHQVKTTFLFNEAANYYLNCCGASQSRTHPICTAKVTSNTLCNNNATRGIDCYHLKLHTVQKFEAVKNDVFVHDDDLEL